MTRKPTDKSIIANFVEFSAATEVDPNSGAQRVAAQPIARVGAGVIGATQRTLNDIREERDRLLAQVAAGSGMELDPSVIDPSPFPDRLPDDGEAEFEAFKTLIREEGQKIPIQVRTHPGAPGRYQIVYGHRRWRAARELGVKVRAMLVELTDSELVVAQGIENAARQDLSWIERALFAWRMDRAGIRARDIRAALGIDDPELARLRAVCRAVPEDVIKALGRTPKVGRPRWSELAGLVSSEPKALSRIRSALSDAKVSALPSDERFRKVLGAVKGGAPSDRDTVDIRTPAGRVVGRISFASDVRLSVEKDRAAAFAAFLKEELPSLMDKFFAREADS